MRNVERPHPVGIQHDLVLAHHAPTLATSETLGTAFNSYLRNQSCKARSCDRSILALLSTRAYSYTQPTPVASGPRDVFACGGSRDCTWFRYSSTRERAQYWSVPSSNRMYTNESPNIE